MLTLYVSQPGCSVYKAQETLQIKRNQTVEVEVQLPLVEQVLIFGKSQVTTQAIQACLKRNIPIGYLSKTGRCYGRILPVQQGYRYLSRHQQQLSAKHKLLVARQIVQAKLKNSRTLLQRQYRRKPSEILDLAIKSLNYLTEKARNSETWERLMGLEGAGAAVYFKAFGTSISNSEFVFTERSKRPPGNPTNALLSFGYQVLWNHIYSLIELQGLDPYFGCLHQASERHAALASDLIEEFRAPIVDSLVLYLINRKIVNAEADFEYRNGGCYLNNSGRVKYLKAFVLRMEEKVSSNSGDSQPRWDLINQQVKVFKRFVYDSANQYQPYLNR
ncbi:CRISPR-associated endonuclease Cas1 [Lyngbya sp. PCC 8106]|uniref:CRISPR-associated endonuclease Cas1 n=1 Tax=Lyngbya sp. (strain PCC 8106) TaxID=313612 RepID=UPI0000EA98E6|nr:CRISPR-associated endonuclease Cas1 [Lyngbya sp. PCC 8106]EAW35190.1 hypothetical protein L8106_13785 [Lyngbya sp. PCC 8106]